MASRCTNHCAIPAIDRLLLPITSSKVLYLGALIGTTYSLSSRITLTQDEAFLYTRSVLEPERDYTAIVKRFELPTFGFEDHCSSQLSYTIKITLLYGDD